jgi:hypothetical protein
VDVVEVEFEQARQQVRIEVEKNPDETLGKVLNLLESWLGEGSRAPTSVEIDDRRYVLGRPPNLKTQLPPTHDAATRRFGGRGLQNRLNRNREILESSSCLTKTGRTSRG